MKTKDGYEIVFAFASIVPPLYNIENPEQQVDSKILEESEPGVEYLLKIFDSAHQDCKIGVRFVSDDKQFNPVREDLVAILDSKSDSNNFNVAEKLATELSLISDERNKTGLFVILIGRKLELYRVVLIRFRAEEVVYKRSLKKGFKIDKLEQAYSSKSKYYKVAYYEGYKANKGTFWEGYILDRQKKSETVVSDYWLKSFLKSDYSMSDAQGTQRLADYIKTFAKEIEDVEEQRTIFESVRSLRYNTDYDHAFSGPISIMEYSERYLPPGLRTRFYEFVGDSELNNSRFFLDIDIYDSELPFKVFIMQNGISLTIPTFMGDNYITIDDINDGYKKYTFEGKLISSKFTKRPN